MCWISAVWQMWYFWGSTVRTARTAGFRRTLDLLGVPYTGAGYLGSAIAMDKIASKQMMDANGIPNPK